MIYESLSITLYYINDISIFFNKRNDTIIKSIYEGCIFEKKEIIKKAVSISEKAQFSQNGGNGNVSRCQEKVS